MKFLLRSGRTLSTLALWLSLSLPVHAGVITAGPVTSTVPATLVDPLGSLSGGLSSTQFLVPIIVTGAIDLQFWSFDLAFDSALVIPLDVGGLFQQVYQAEFDNGFITNIESSGFLLNGVLEGISGSAPTVSGDGPLAYVLFQFLPTATVAEPESILLVLPVLLALGWRHRRPHLAQPA